MERAGGHERGEMEASKACPFWAVLTEAGRDGCDLMSWQVPSMNWTSDRKTSGRHSGLHIWLWQSDHAVSDINSRPVYCHLICALHLLWPYKVAVPQLVNVYQVCSVYSLIISNVVLVMAWYNIKPWYSWVIDFYSHVFAHNMKDNKKFYNI